MIRTNIERAEWLINRALLNAEGRKMKRALNAPLGAARRIGDYEQAARIIRELRKLGRSMRRYRRWMAEEHPGQTASVEINVT